MIRQKITKAIIPVAGYGTRRLPVAKAIEKCMIPICNRPVVDYTVEECLQAGVEDIFFVVSPGFEQLRSYYSRNVELEEYLDKRGKAEALQELKNIPRKANFHYIIQDPSKAYGTAVPIWMARDVIEDDERFLVTFGDSFMFHGPGSEANDFRDLIATVAQHGTNGALLGVAKSDDEMVNSGAIRKRSDSGVTLLVDITEKPAPGTAPSSLASISYFIFDKGIMPFAKKVIDAVHEHGEHYLTDAVNAYVAAGNEMAVVESTGQQLDGGNLHGWIKANQVVYEAQFQN